VSELPSPSAHARRGAFAFQVERIAASRHRGEEDLLAKARWFAQFSPPERLRMLIEWADAMLALNPKIEAVDRARPVAGRVQVLERP
jgi:hypothetical protein